MTEMID